MEDHKQNCIELYYHRGNFRYLCGDSILSSCKYFNLRSGFGVDCKYRKDFGPRSDYLCECKAAQKDAKIEISDSLECD
jgi:hypothetical protein